MAAEEYAGFKHGRYSASSIQQWRHVAALIREMRET
jgi:hypothetical protein